jgi:hypothetical protein
MHRPFQHSNTKETLMDMQVQDLATRRQRLVNETMGRIADIDRQLGKTREAVNRMKDELLALARHRELLVTSEFKPAVRGTFKDFVAYRINEDDGSGRALYVSLALPGKTSPPHNHNNWAILVGIDGVEVNYLYRADPQQGFQQTDRIEVGPGVGLALMGDDIHSIEVLGQGDVPVWQLRCYERALELQTDRVQFDPDGKTELFPPNQNTKDGTAAA